MGLFTKLILALLVIGGLAPFTFIKGKDGKPLMSFSDIKMPNTKLPDIDIPSLPDSSITPSNSTSSKPNYKEGTVFKWKDKEGTWQFSSEPPPEGSDFSSTLYNNTLNVIQSVETPRTRAEKEKQKQATNTLTGKTIPKSLDDVGSPYSPEKIETLFNDANNLETLLKDRAKQQEDLLKNL